MLRFIRYLIAATVASFTATSCEVVETRQPTPWPEAVSYETGSDEPDDLYGSETARIAATNGNVAFQNITNDLTFAQAYTVSFWWFGAFEPGQLTRFDRDAIDGLPAAQRDYPKTAIKNNLRYYASKSLKAGWWMAKGGGSEVIYKFQVTTGAKHLLQIDDENNPTFGTGFNGQRGKVKVSIQGKINKPTEANISINGRSYHLFSRDGGGVYKYVSWYLPPGTYAATWTDATGQPKTVSVNITTDGKFPHIKLNS